MKRGVGVSAVTKKKTEQKHFQAVGKVMDDTRMANVQETLSKFQTSLIQFAEKHKDKINSDPEFRYQFHVMCMNVGIGWGFNQFYTLC
jgi:ESCRT-II complex subunit VPS22